MKKKKAFLSGISGMDGSHMADLLLEKDYKVYGLMRRSSNENPWRIKHILDRIEIVRGDLLDRGSLDKALIAIQPDEIYNFAAQSFVAESFKTPTYTSDVTGLGALRLIDAVFTNCSKKTRVYQASSSEMFGDAREMPQNELTPFRPRSPYGCAKVFSHQICVNYRESYKMHISCGICFNHEGPRRGEEFVTRKITKGVAEIKKKKKEKIILGNLNALRDWGYAPDFVEAMWLMLQQEKPDDYIIATGKSHSIDELLKIAFGYVDLDYKKHIAHNKKYLRPSDISLLLGDYSKIERKLGWKPKTSFKQMIEKMVREDLKRLK